MRPYLSALYLLLWRSYVLDIKYSMKFRIKWKWFLSLFPGDSIIWLFMYTGGGNSYISEQLFSSHDDYHSLESKTTSKFCIALELLLGNWANFLQSHRGASTSSSISLHLLVFGCFIWLWGIFGDPHYHLIEPTLVSLKFLLRCSYMWLLCMHLQVNYI